MGLYWGFFGMMTVDGCVVCVVEVLEVVLWKEVAGKIASEAGVEAALVCSARCRQLGADGGAKWWDAASFINTVQASAEQLQVSFTEQNQLIKSEFLKTICRSHSNSSSSINI